MERLAAEDGNAQVADWFGAATGTPGLLYGDGYHARPEGYAMRGAILAEAISACSGAGAGGGDLSGIPAPSGKRRCRSPTQVEPEPPLEVPGPSPATPAPLAALGMAVRNAARLLSSAGRDARQAAGIAPPEPVLGAAE